MTDEERKEKEKIERAARAEMILNDDMVAAALQEIENACMKTIRDSRPDEQLLRDDNYRMMRLVKSFRHHFERHLRTGEVAQGNLAEIERRRGLFRRVA